MESIDHGLRASDADRERAIDRLGAEAAAGRLTPAELDERTDRAISARTQGDLDTLFTDLPRAPRPNRRREHRRAALRGHAVSFVLVNLLLIGVWAATGFGYFWPIWPLMGWGIGLASHAAGGRRGVVGCGRHRRIQRV